MERSRPSWNERSQLRLHGLRSLLATRALGKIHVTASHTLAVLRDVDLQLDAGDTLAVVGPSGSGKTTLLGLCAGLDAPTSGSVHLAGHDLGALDEDARAQVRNDHVGFIFQNFQLLPTLTAVENVLVPLELRGLGPVANAP